VLRNGSLPHKNARWETLDRPFVNNKLDTDLAQYAR
jgi:hypothetical protein